MAQGKGQIGLTIAERHNPTKQNFDYRSASVEKWVQALPVGNVGETARLVYGALHEVNRLNISWRDRQRFLEQLRQPVHYIQESLTKRYSGMAFPLPHKTQRIASLSQTLYLEMALGYKTAIEEMLGSSFLTRDNKALTEVIHRAVRYLSQAMLASYQIYAPHPQNSWFELHMLYLHAEYKKLHQTPVSDRFNTAMPESSIARVYKQILLLALASPYRLRQGCAKQLHEALTLWAGHAHIIPYNSPEASDALFVVHMDSDDAPDYQAFNHRDCNTELCRLVDTRQLTHILQEELKHRASEGQSGTISPKLMQQLIRSWGVAPKRHFSRNERESMIEVVVGSSMLHQALAHQLGDESQYSKRSSYESRSIANVSQTASEDVWDIFASSKIQSHYEAYEKDLQPKPSQPREPDLQIQQWQIRNESAGGYRLALAPEQQAKVQVGELLGLRNPQSNNTWEIGAVRWIRQPAEGGLEIGVQVLAPQALPVTVRNLKAGGRAAQHQYALLLPDIPVIGQPASLITPILLFTPGNEVHLHMPGKEMRVMLSDILQDSGNFVQFRFSAKPEPAVRKSGQDDHSTHKESRFGSLWDEL